MLIVSLSRALGLVEACQVHLAESVETLAKMRQTTPSDDVLVQQLRDLEDSGCQLAKVRVHVCTQLFMLGVPMDSLQPLDSQTSFLDVLVSG